MDANLSGRCIPDPVVAKIEAPVDLDCFNGKRNQVQKTQPFNISPINYQGIEKISNIPSDIIRWVLVELREASDSTKLVDRRAALLRIDSVLVDTNFSVGVYFPKAISNQAYYLVIRYDSFGFLMSKEIVKLPNNNDYNLNRTQKLLTVSNNSPIIYNSRWIGVDTFYVCQGQSIIINDSNLVKAGYQIESIDITSNWQNIKTPKDHEIVLDFENDGFYPIELYMNCQNHFTIRSLFFVKVWPKPKAEIFGPDSFCIGDTIVLTSGNFTYYKWSTGDVTNFSKIFQPGKYNLNIIDVHGCSSFVEKEVEFYPEIKGKVVSEPDLSSDSCKIYFIPENTFSKYVYFWSNGQQKDTIQTKERFITLVVKDSNECSKLFSVMCSTLSNEENLKKDLQIIPNPNPGTFRLVIDKKFKDGLIQLLDFNGKILLRRNISGIEDYFNLNKNDIPAGMYLIKVFKNEYQLNRKVIILH